MQHSLAVDIGMLAIPEPDCGADLIYHRRMRVWNPLSAVRADPSPPKLGGSRGRSRARDRAAQWAR